MEADHRPDAVRGGDQHFKGRLEAQPGRSPAVVGARRAAALHVAEDRHPGVLAEPLLQHVAHPGRGDRLARALLGALGDHHHGVAAAVGAGLPQRRAHGVLPALLGRVLRDQDVVAAAGDRRHQGQVAAVAAHHLDHEAALVAGRGAGQRVDRLDDAVQRGIGADGGVGADQVVVDRADQAGEHQGGVGFGDLPADLPGLDQFGEQAGPVGAELVQARERAVPADHHQPVDALLQQVAGGAPPSLPLPEVLAAEGADDGAALVQDAAHVRPGELADAVAAVDHALEALVDRGHASAPAQRGADHRADGGVHALRVTAACENAQMGLDGRAHRRSGSLEGFPTVLRNRVDPVHVPR